MRNSLYARVGKQVSTLGVAILALSVLGANSVEAAVAEHSLAGIKLFSHATVLLKKFGTPTAIKVGAASTLGGGAAGGGGGGGLPGFGGGGPPPGFGGASGPPPGFGGGGFGGGGGGFGGGGAAPAAAGGGVVWEYDRPDGSDLEFTLSADGRVIQIRATGYKGSVRTGKGLILGTGLADVYTKYGYPETTTLAGGVLTLGYSERSHIAFQLMNQKIVGIVVAVVE